MRENRPYGSEGGVARNHPYPYSRQEFLYHLILSVIRDSALTSLNVPAKAMTASLLL
jgi:hypothetical protein